jgi:uncharacterized protein YjbI with pentapeptide repeats
LSGVSFEKAKLRRANFSKVRLDNASFIDADLVLTKFVGSSLKRANLSAGSVFVPPTILAAQAVGDMYASYGTIFACADLTKADLSGRVIFTLIYDDPIWGGSQRDEFYGANLDHADLSRVQFATALPMSKFAGDSMKERVPDALLSMPLSAVGASTDPLHYSGNDLYRVWLTQPPWPGDFTLAEHFKTDAMFGFGSIHSARNWPGAVLPEAFRKVLSDGALNFDKPPVSYDCATGQKKADISSMFDGSHTTGSARF